MSIPGARNRAPSPAEGGRMPTRRVLVRLLARLDASPLPVSDRVRLDLEAELIALLARVERRDVLTRARVSRRGR